MKVVKHGTDAEIINLPLIRISTTELVNIVKNTSSAKMKVDIRIGPEFGDHIILETLEEIEEHAAQIRIPCLISMEGLTIDFSKYHSSITYQQSQEALARSLERRLTAYSVWYGVIFKRPEIPILSLIAMFTIAYKLVDPKLSALEFALAIGGTFLFVCLFLIKFAWNFNRPYIAHVERDGFWRRNSDKIWIGIMMLIVGMVLRELIMHFNS